MRVVFYLKMAFAIFKDIYQFLLLSVIFLPFPSSFQIGTSKSKLPLHNCKGIGNTFHS